MGILTKKGERAVGDFLESKSSPSGTTEGWLRLALFGKDVKDSVESHEGTAMLMTYLAASNARIKAIDFAWGIAADAREYLFKYLRLTLCKLFSNL
jgi:hypothetical protein